MAQKGTTKLWNGLLKGLPSCGMAYYSMNVGVGLVAVLAYGYTAKKYKYRKRDDICNVYAYAEDYYSKIP